MSMKDNKIYTSEVFETEDGELAFEFSEELLNQMGWGEGTEIEWLIENDKIIMQEVTNVSACGDEDTTGTGV